MAGGSGVGRPACALAVFLVLGAAFAPAAARAAFGIESFDAKAVDENGQLYEQAGAHPFEGYTKFALNTLPSGAPDGNVRDIRVDVPPGLMSNPQAIPACSDAELTSLAGCPVNTQVGVVDATTFALGLAVPLQVPLYNMTIGPDQVGRFAFDPKQVVPVLGGLLAPVLEAALGDLDPVQIIGGVRDTSDYGQFFTITGVAAKPEITAATLTFWGVPGDPAHDPKRGQVCVTVAVVPACALGGKAATAGQIPFLTNPTKCAGALTTTLTVVSHAGERASEETSTPDGPQHCELVPFEPTISLGPETVPRDAPAGIAFNLHVPQTQFKDVLGSSHVDDVSVKLPPGMTIDPSAANGLEACTDAQLPQGTHDPVTCPAASRIGDVQVVSTLLPDPLVGPVYLGQPLPGDRYRLFLVAEGHGVTARLKGSVTPDPATGQLTATFHDNPQVAFTNLTLTLRGGPRAPLAMPLDCGTATAGSRITPYSGTAPATPAASVTVSGCGDGAPFAPALGARSASGLSGAFAPFALSIGRDDGHQFLADVSVDLPPGLLGMVARVPRCPDAAAATGACPAASRVGTATAAAGAGPEPFSLSGPVYLTGPYRGAPFGLAVAIRAIAGPFDLGTVVVRQRIEVGYDDAHLTVVSDPLPQVLEGVPLRLRSVVVDVDRDRFMRNPTSCGAKQVTAAFGSSAGGAHGASAGLTFGGCERLPFAPRLKLALVGRKQLRTGRHPGLRARVTQKQAEAGIQSARVTLPLSLALDPANARQLCEYEAGLRGQCPPGSIIGRVQARTPVLDGPLRGPVYFVKGVRVDPATGRQIRTLPTLLASLRGEVAIDLRAATAVQRGRLVTTFPAVPDAPITSFTMSVAGGRNGILVANKKLCGRKQVARSVLGGHNGKRSARSVRIGLPCKVAKHKRGGKRSHPRGGKRSTPHRTRR
jgi:hypothetical protein